MADYVHGDEQKLNEILYIVKSALERVRIKLLDISRRNNLINFRETRRTIRIIDELPDETFRQLVTEGKLMELLQYEPPQELDQNTQDDNNKKQEALPFDNSGEMNDTTQIDENAGNNDDSEMQGQLDYELPEPTDNPDPRYVDNCLQTPLIAQTLERRCKNILRDWRTGIEETGINFLYLAIDFLEWYEDDNSDVVNRAPLLLVPLRIERTRLNRETNCYTYVVSYSGEDIETNLSLAERLERDFGLILPEVTDDVIPEDYFLKVNETIKGKRRWRVAREMVIAFFSFAKIRIYKDLNDESWPDEDLLTDKQIVQQILVGCDKDETDTSIPYGEEFAIDEHPDVDKIPLVLDADSSQHSAIIDILMNKNNLVIEGPPGTGKSQTITNLVAAALHEGKSVLFVSEKKAALEVVRKRLDIVGLGDFCLELHSHKTQKGQLHADLAKRMNKQYQDTRDLDYEIDELRRESKRLQSYYELLNSTPGSTKETIYEIFWASERWRGEIDNSPVRFYIDNSLRLTRSQVNDGVAKVKDFECLYFDLPGKVIDVWNGFDPNILLPGDEEEICEKLYSLQAATEHFTKRMESSLEEYGIPIGKKITELRQLNNVNTDVFSSNPDYWNESLSLSFLDDEPVAVLAELSSMIKKYREQSIKANEVLGNHNDFTLEDLKYINQAANQLEKCGYYDKTPEQLQELCKNVSSVSEAFDEFKKAAEPSYDFLLEIPERLNEVLHIVKIRDILNEASPDITLHAYPEHALRIADSLQDTAYKIHQQLCESLSGQSDQFRIDKLPDIEEIHRLAETFRKYTNWLSRLFSSEYRRAKQNLRNFLIDRKLFKKSDFAERLDELARNQKRIHAYRQNEDYQRVFGPLFKGVETNWKRLKEMIIWSQKLTSTIGSESRAKLLIQNFLDNKEKVCLTANKILILWQSIEEDLKHLNLEVNENEKLSDIYDKIQKRGFIINDTSQKFIQFQQFSHIDIVSLKDATQAGLIAKQLHKQIEGNSRFYEHLGDAYQGLNTNIEALQSMVEWIIRLEKKGELGTDIIRWLLTSDTELRISVVNSLVNDSKEFFDNLKIFIKELFQVGDFDFNEWLNIQIENATIYDLLDKLDTCIDTSNYLIAWADYCRAKRELIESGLLPIAQGIEEKSIVKGSAEAYFRLAVYQSMVKEVLSSYPELATFQRATYDNTRERIAKIDQEIKNLSRQRVAYSITRRKIPAGKGSGYVRDYTELSLINHEISKKKKHIPIRQLVRRAGNALQAIKPCFMMSPLSVAQYLVPGEVYFDLVVMDEASQLRLEDALGAIARSNQVVVVGDPKQLPPTTFFERLNEIDIDDEERIAAEDAESILDICQNCFDKRRLRWHYRSEHENLITFSNNEFYDNDLIVFPSPYSKNEDYGVHHHYVERATYKNRRNRMEAEVVAGAIMDHFKRYPELSLGVATFNLQQRDLIQDELERLQKKNNWLEQHIKGTEKSEEPFFIKNLENVQGDERDVIFISTTYGPDRDTGQVYQRFGPINHPMGWRRLNVIVTRAKKRLEFFTSMLSSDVRIGSGISRGIVALRRYIEYAEKGIIPYFGKETDREPGSDFQIAVSKLLNQHGYKTTPEVGVAGFFIDIGVHHPDQEGEFILGIECDGASYHSAKSIRDRDLLRQKILETKGWQIYRIWSTDWFKNRDKELNKLLESLEILVESRRPKVRRITLPQKPIPAERIDEVEVRYTDKEFRTGEKTDNDDALRKVLLEYRRKKIEPTLEDLSKSILSDGILEFFIEEKPTTREEFWKLPYDLRNKISAGQGKYLEEILEVVEEFTI